MTENQQAYTLQSIRHDLDLAISQVAVFNLYVDRELDDSNFSNCLISLKSSLQDIANRLQKYQRLESSPSVATDFVPTVAHLESSTNG